MRIIQTIELTTLDASLSDALKAAQDEPIVLTERVRPAYVVRSLVDDDSADDLIALHPDFLASIRLARQQKTEGKVKTLAETRKQYTPSNE